MLLFFFVFFITNVYAQTVRLTGKIIDSKNEPVSGASVKIASGSAGMSTDLEGRFSLNLTPGKKYELEISAINYETKTVSDVEVIAGQLNELNIILELKPKSEANVTVTAKKITAPKETVASAIAFQKNTNTVASVISA